MSVAFAAALGDALSFCGERRAGARSPQEAGICHAEAPARNASSYRETRRRCLLNSSSHSSYVDAVPVDSARGGRGNTQATAATATTISDEHIENLNVVRESVSRVP